MSELPFAGYVFCCVAGFVAQLAFALREWRTLGRRGPMFVDNADVRVERYFGLAFRQKLDAWLREPRRTVAPGLSVVDTGREEIWIHDALAVPSGSRHETVVVAATLDTGHGCGLLREVYTRGDCRLGPANVVQALAADGDVRVGRGTRIVRWVDAGGTLVIEPHCRVDGRATAGRRLVLHAGARVSSAHAAEIVTVSGGDAGDAVHGPSSMAHGPRDVDGIRLPAVLTAEDDGWRAAGARGVRRRLAPDCVVYAGDLVLPTVTLQTRLVVDGDLVVGPGSVLSGDVKATGSIQVGAHATCHGNLVAGRDVRLDAQVTFSGVIFAEGTVTLASGTAGTRARSGVAVYGAGDVRLEPGVTIQGKVSSGAAVVVTGG